MYSFLFGIGFTALGKAGLSLASSSATPLVSKTIKKTWSTRKHPAITLDDYRTDHGEDGYEIPESLTSYCVCHTKVDDRHFSVVTVVASNLNRYTVRHLIADDRLSDLERVLTAVDSPIWQSDSWVFKPDDFVAPVRTIDTSFSTSYHPDADTRSDIHCFAVEGHAFSVVLTRSVLDVQFGVCTGDIRSHIGKIAKLGPQTKSGFVRMSAAIDPWWTMPTPKSPELTDIRKAQKEIRDESDFP
jgi:hypothetical protein